MAGGIVLVVGILMVVMGASIFEGSVTWFHSVLGFTGSAMGVIVMGTGALMLKYQYRG